MLVGCLCFKHTLFQAHKDGISSVAEYKVAYDTGEFRIYDEYGYEYNWDAFDDRVLKHNGGILGVQKPEKIEQNKRSRWYDKNMPDFLKQVKTGKSFDLDAARVVAKKSIDHIDEMCDEFLKNEWSIDETINALLDDVQYEIMRIAIKKEIGDELRILLGIILLVGCL